MNLRVHDRLWNRKEGIQELPAALLPQINQLSPINLTLIKKNKIKL